MTPGKRKDSASTADLLESLAESRLAALHLARQAQEAKDPALAKELGLKARALAEEIRRLRRQRHGEWTAKSQALQRRVKTAGERLQAAARRAENQRSIAAGADRLIGMADGILKATRRLGA